ncbi:hypothetical protein [Litoreibacter albidus]|uniref:Uncharacterized protein n=1 Tax=Litoreibacter albidus TaxID=670155 RepID=A0A1H2V3V3_9RHOB|nr:hypothetical protein [Litoreibacter albidus]SDW62629.1 hypothetical protein SAMN04488001_1380 [Litoreibacter albidus]
MTFEVRIEDPPPASGFDIGELLLTCPLTSRRSTPQPNRKCYMVYVELSVLVDQAVSAKINKTINPYVLPSGSKVTFDGKGDLAVLEFPDLNLTQSLDEAIHDLRDILASSVETLQKGASEDDVMLGQLRDGLLSSEGI